jgi:heme/copper-type cytochrome/quinol oxidase subunit 1
LTVAAAFLFGVRLIFNAAAGGTTLPRATWAILTTGVAGIVAWRFLAVYVRLLLVDRSTQRVETIRLVLSDPRT